MLRDIIILCLAYSQRCIHFASRRDRLMQILNQDLSQRIFITLGSDGVNVKLLNWDKLIIDYV